MIYLINMIFDNKLVIVVWLKKNCVLGIRCIYLKEFVFVSDLLKLYV